MKKSDDPFLANVLGFYRMKRAPALTLCRDAAIAIAAGTDQKIHSYSACRRFVKQETSRRRRTR